MNQHSKKKRRHHLPIKTLLVITVVFSVVWIASAFSERTDRTNQRVVKKNAEGQC